MLKRALSLAQSRSKIPFDMFELSRTAGELRSAEKLRNIYRRGQDQAWDGQAVLQELVARHGPVRLEAPRQQALARILEILLWGELAAWKVSAELADLVGPLEAKMALTSQAHDEARHFYVLHDYLQLLGCRPRHIDPYSQQLLDRTLNTRSIPRKMLGMQLLIETIALTIFAEVRRTEAEPVLVELLRYYEKDEARHVGVGTQYLPSLLGRLSRAEAASVVLFQVELLGWAVASLKNMEPDLAVLGISAREMLARGQAKQLEMFEELWAALGGQSDFQAADRMVAMAQELFFPPEGQQGARSRLRAAWRSLQQQAGGAP